MAKRTQPSDLKIAFDVIVSAVTPVAVASVAFYCFTPAFAVGLLILFFCL